MNGQEKNVQIVKDVYAALNRGDVQFVLDRMADSVDWQSPATGTITEPLSWARPRHSREEVREFFVELFEQIKPLEVKPVTFTAQDERVIVEGYTRGLVKVTGNEFATSWTMVFTLRNGTCIRMRHYFDTADIVQAFMAVLHKAA
jgi:ketosteroid isomerase-like protein